MIPAIRSTDRIYVQHPIFLIVGLPGLGKSTLGFSCEKPVSLNFDSESAQARTVNRGDSLNILTVDDLEDLEKNGHPWITEAETIIHDTVGCCIDLMAAAVIKDNPKCRQGDGSLTQKGWGELKRRYHRFINKQRQAGKNLLLITHAKEKEQGDTMFYRPMIDGGARDYVIQQADFIGFLRMVGKERVLDFSPTDAWHGKNPAQWPAWTLPAPEQARTFMAQLYQKGRDYLSQASEVSAGKAQQVDDWKIAIADYTLIDEFNRAVPQIQKLNATVQPQVVKILMERARALGFTYNQEAKVFSAPAPQRETVLSL